MNTETRSIRSQALDLLRFPLAIVVVTIHVFTGFSTTMHEQVYDFSGYTFFMNVILFSRSFLAGQSVPIYFFIAGYVFFLGVTLTKETYLRKMHNRFKSLFIPYIIWNSVALLLILFPFLPMLHSIFPGCNYHDLQITFRNIISSYWIYDGAIRGTAVDSTQTFLHPADTPMWFIRTLMILAVCTPVINMLLKRFGALLPAISGTMWFFLTNVDGVSPFWYMMITGIFFFSSGAFLSFHRRDMVEEFRKFRIFSFILYPLTAAYLFAYSLASDNWMEIAGNGFIANEMKYVKNIAIIAGLLFAYNFAVWLIERHGFKSSKTLSSAAFFIYAGHMPLIGYVKNIVMSVIPPVDSIHCLLIYSITEAVICFGLLGVYVIMRRYTPRFLGLFTGGRL